MRTMRGQDKRHKIDACKSNSHVGKVNKGAQYKVQKSTLGIKIKRYIGARK